MFENIIGQAVTITSLKNDIVTANFPPAVLFHGPEYSAKLTAALEVARVLDCTADSAWNCACRSCEQHRQLTHPNLLLLGTRDYTMEIAAAADTLKRTGKSSARYLFIRAVRKQIKGYDPVLWEGDAAKAKGNQQTIQEIGEALSFLMPGLPLPEEKKLETLLAQIAKLCVKITASSRSDNIPIDQVRNAVFWAHHSSASGKKIIIMEHADKMQDSSRNALLKILEEPPASLQMILLSTNKSAIIRTILSRVRPYPFHERTEKEARDILARIFREELADFASLKDYFQGWKALNPGLLKSLVHQFMNLVSDSSPPVVGSLNSMEELFKASSPRDAWLSFTAELFTHFRQKLAASSRAEIARIEKWTRILRDAAYQVEHLNMSPKNMLEAVYFKFKLGV